MAGKEECTRWSMLVDVIRLVVDGALLVIIIGVLIAVCAR